MIHRLADALPACNLHGRIEIEPADQTVPPTTRALARGGALKPAGTIIGRVVDARTGPLAGAKVTLQEMFNDNGAASNGYVGTTATTDSDGRYKLEYVEPDREFWLLVLKDQFGHPRDQRKFKVDPGATLELPDVVMHAKQ